jgi:catechol 2,3-dioxygenase-like lactoylglutathione lyase family enzyme
MHHLALEVSDQERARRFYETYCGFGVEPPRRYDDGTLMLYDGVAIVEQWDEPDYVSVKCRDPDGHIVEFSWETT